MPPSGMLITCGTIPGSGTSEKVTVIRSPLRSPEKESPLPGVAASLLAPRPGGSEPGKTKRSGGLGSEKQPASRTTAQDIRLSAKPRSRTLRVISWLLTKRDLVADQYLGRMATPPSNWPASLLSAEPLSASDSSFFE